MNHWWTTEATSLSKGCSQIPFTAHGLSHILFEKPQGDKYGSQSVLWIPHTQGSGSISTEAALQWQASHSNQMHVVPVEYFLLEGFPFSHIEVSKMEQDSLL